MDCATRQCDRCVCLDWSEIDPKYRVLLAPVDNIAESALKKAFERGRISYQTFGCSYLLDYTPVHFRELKQLLWTHLPSLLHSRIKGILLSVDRDRRFTFRDFVTAESLPVFFDQAEVSWVREIFRKEGLYSVFHPVVHTRSLKPVAFEALIRGTHPFTGEMVSAGELIYACARLNNLDELDSLARDCSIRSAVRISDHSAPIFINYLPNAVGDPEQCFSNSFDEAHKQGIETSRLIFEAVEAESAMSLVSMRETQLYLKSMGARFALDNLGRGHAAVELLEKLNPDFAKLDSNLISTAVVSPRARVELERICLSSQQIGTKLIAEGVESIDQMRLCLRCGIELMQGFLFAFPSSPEEATHPIKGYIQPAAA